MCVFTLTSTSQRHRPFCPTMTLLFSNNLYFFSLILTFVSASIQSIMSLCLLFLYFAFKCERTFWCLNIWQKFCSILNRFGFNSTHVVADFVLLLIAGPTEGSFKMKGKSIHDICESQVIRSDVITLLFQVTVKYVDTDVRLCCRFTLILLTDVK